MSQFVPCEMHWTRIRCFVSLNLLVELRILPGIEVYLYLNHGSERAAEISWNT